MAFLPKQSELHIFSLYHERSFHATLLSLMNELTVFLMAMLPITELQGAIVYGVTVLDMNPWWAFLWGTAGSITMCFFLLVFLERTTIFLRKHSPFFDRFFDKLFERTRHKYSERMSELGHLALFTYIAIPTPGSGGWTGALIAYVFGVPRKKAALILGFGLVVTGLIVMLGTEGVMKLF